jgi:hypothetical protein
MVGRGSIILLFPYTNNDIIMLKINKKLSFHDMYMVCTLHLKMCITYFWFLPLPTLFVDFILQMQHVNFFWVQIHSKEPMGLLYKRIIILF